MGSLYSISTNLVHIAFAYDIYDKITISASIRFVFMTTALFTHPAGLAHENGPGHPESPARLKAILSELEKPDYTKLIRHEAPQATIDQIARVHNRGYIEEILKHVPTRGYAQLDPDTALSPHSGEAALRAAGAVIAAVDDIANGKTTNAFCAMRPPGHHAEHATAMGFCLFNNIAIGAAHALAIYNAKRVAIVDFDVHHGNGTEEWAAAQPNVLFFSSHQFPLWPGSGRAEDKGPLGNIVNIPLPPGTGSAGFRHVMQSYVLPKITDYAPDFIFISAGFDAHGDDPLAGLDFTTEDFGWITTELCKLAARFCAGHIVSSLEGGYDLDALAASAGAHAKALLNA
jgi:acetoin utilization deacetylase AcuC-like enzyme